MHKLENRLAAERYQIVSNPVKIARMNKRQRRGLKVLE